ncbi:DUF4307 domain-containing protein [Nocardiopsis ansamitocini]|uniref:DUF4307 domain-containing protein n=1 Tax=Nocardiopsis ansamitocini TaxID=1670832 RepID=A0A9W6P4D6_9ACTN|nr:DUF4307 domain-containing protein [Nocardiopsis ansamitocini]GLU46852.1 hypothetical protein Nans01_12030 [Nocardiopsis ansamitocini]
MPPTPDEATADAAPTAAPARRRLGNKPFFFVLGVLAAAVFTVGWGLALLSYSGNGPGQVHYQTVAWKVVSDSEAHISFQVNSKAGALCLITATDAQHVQVGQTEVSVGSGVQDTGTTIDTVRRASAVEVASCREQGLSTDSTE